MTPRAREIAILSWACLLLFAARVLGQFEVYANAPAWLPDMDAWYSGLLPYHLLLPVQVVLLMIMAVVAWNRRVRTGRFTAANPRLAVTLRALALLYFVVMAVRLAIDVNTWGDDFWRHGAIPVAFHWVLALFLLISARAGSPSMPRSIRFEELDEPPHGDVPAIAQPLLRLSNYR